ncbi:MAG: hypothetical protein GWN30_21940, partial [Gammaproteobacteria bacterium]|nr:hypothetical protein [Gammaproteobacteria bacterium]
LEYFKDAKLTLTYIFDHMSDGELREYFLKREDVMGVFDTVGEVV